MFVAAVCAWGRCCDEGSSQAACSRALGLQRVIFCGGGVGAFPSRGSPSDGCFVFWGLWIAVCTRTMHGRQGGLLLGKVLGTQDQMGEGAKTTVNGD